MNSLVNPLDGRMEDWAYASSWQDSLTGTHTLKSCTPTTFGGYDPEKTVYNAAVLRCVNIQVDGVGNGHGPRNIRLLLLMTDLVEPYVIMLEHKVIVDHGIVTADLKWEVGGALHVDETEIFYISGNMQNRDAWSVKKTNISGPTFFEHPREDDEMGDVNLNNTGRGVFAHRLDLGSTDDGTVYWFQVRVKVDQKWGEQPAEV